MLPRDPAHKHGEYVQEFCDGGFVFQRIECHLFKKGAIKLPCPPNGRADITLDSAPLALMLLSNWEVDSILNAQKAVFIT